MGWVLWKCVFLTLPLQAVHFVAVEDPQHNTTPPQDASEARLWHLQGHWNAFLGTPIADQWFVTAKHVGGSLGDTFHLMGQPYMAVVKIPDPESDLTLWGVSDPFPDVVPIYSGSQEAGRRTLLLARGPHVEKGLGGGQWKPDPERLESGAPAPSLAVGRKQDPSRSARPRPGGPKPWRTDCSFL